MTALDQYIRLESPGRWREQASADWRDVYVSFGNATLVLSTFDDKPLTHWSLAAVQRVEHAPGRAVYAPDAATPEALEVTDETMIDAIAEVTKMVRQGRTGTPQRRFRRWMTFGLGLAAVGALFWWGPDALRTRAFQLITPEQAELVAESMRPALPGRRCRTPEGQRALLSVAKRLDPNLKVEVRDWEAPAISVLPDSTVLLGRGALESAPSAEAVAGWIALGAAQGPKASPLYRWTRALGPRELMAFLSSGEVPQADIEELAQMITSQATTPDGPAIRRAFDRLLEKSIAAGPLALALDRSAPDPPQTPLLVLPRDQDWVALQNICQG